MRLETHGGRPRRCPPGSQEGTTWRCNTLATCPHRPPCQDGEAGRECGTADLSRTYRRSLALGAASVPLAAWLLGLAVGRWRWSDRRAQASWPPLRLRRAKWPRRPRCHRSGRCCWARLGGGRASKVQRTPHRRAAWHRPRPRAWGEEPRPGRARWACRKRLPRGLARAARLRPSTRPRWRRAARLSRGPSRRELRR